MFLSFNGQVFTFKCAYESRHVAKNAGFIWSPAMKTWYTPYIAIAKSLIKYADSYARHEFDKLSIKVNPEIYRIEWPTGLTPRSYQLDGARWALSRNRCLLRHDPGLGKTIEAVLCMNSRPGKVLIICPPFLKINWKREILKWSIDRSLSIETIESGKVISFDFNADVLIVPDSLVSKPDVYKMLAARKFTWLFVDEAHRYKNNETQRTKALFGLQQKRGGLFQNAEHVVALTGTPMPSRPIELYPILNALAPESIDYAGKTAFAERFCGAYFDGFGMNMNGASRQEELNVRMKDKFMHVLKKGDVLKELPPKIHEKIMIPYSGLSKQMAEMDEAMMAMRELADEALGQMSAHRRDLGLLKADYCAEFIKDILETSNEKILVFAWHTDVIAKLAESLKEFSPMVITGAVSAAARMGIVDAFQNDKSKRIIIGNIQAMGVGLTLTEASRVVFTEFSWVPADNEQAEDRAHRLGQMSSVFVQYLAVEGSIDEWQLDTVMRKRKNIERVTG